MNGRTATFLSIIAVSMFSLSCGRHNEPVQAQAAAKVQQWEYNVVVLPMFYWGASLSEREAQSTKAHKEELNKLGADGWDFCHTDSDRRVYVFKRPKR